MKKNTYYYRHGFNIFIMLTLFICTIPSTLFAAITPADIAQMAETLPPVSATNPESGITIYSYSGIVRALAKEEAGIPPTVLGAFRVVSEFETIDTIITISIIGNFQPGEKLEVVRPNLTGSSWAATDIAGKVGKNGKSVLIPVHESGAYAVFNPAWTAYQAEKMASVLKKGSIGKQKRSLSDPWGLILENDAGSEKIALILVHGDNSFKYDKDRWNYFLEWVEDNPGFNNRYEIWRFHHDTSKLIGYDGKSGNALELGKAINEQFGPDRPILILAHSRGGLVSRSYMSRYGDGNEGYRVLGLVTLATPHHGSPGAVPDWGLDTVEGKFKDTELAELLYGYTYDQVVNVSDKGTMGLAWDNFDGPENGAGYISYNLSSKLGDTHMLSVMDTNMQVPVLNSSEEDTTLYIPDRSSGTLEALNHDDRYSGRIIAYGGYDSDLGVGGEDPFNWINFSFSDHTGLDMSIHLMANMRSRTSDGWAYHFMANDGMVPLQSALLLKKDTAGEPMYTVEKDKKLLFMDSYKIWMKNFIPRMRVRKAVLCKDFDHLHMVEGKGGLLNERSDYWDHVSGSLNEMASLSDEERQSFTPRKEDFEPSPPPLSEVISGDNCFIGATAFNPPFLLLIMAMLAGGIFALRRRK